MTPQRAQELEAELRRLEPVIVSEMVDQRPSWPVPLIDDELPLHGMNPNEAGAFVKQARYQDQRCAHAEAIGRPYSDERHPVWPR